MRPDDRSIHFAKRGNSIRPIFSILGGCSVRPAHRYGELLTQEKLLLVERLVSSTDRYGTVIRLTTLVSKGGPYKATLCDETRSPA
jgi:hypothetical protein